MSSHTVSIYQTLENRGNPDEIEAHGPYLCTSPKAWLGKGYYFWDTFIFHAHAWGEKSYGGNYVICKASFQFDWDFVFDVVGNMEHVQMLEEIARVLHENGRICTVAKSLEILKSKTDFSRQYIAVRAKDEKVDLHHRISFTNNGAEYMSTSPRVQICFFDKSLLMDCGYKIIYPEEYIHEPVGSDMFTTI